MGTRRSIGMLRVPGARAIQPAENNRLELSRYDHPLRCTTNLASLILFATPQPLAETIARINCICHPTRSSSQAKVRRKSATLSTSGICSRSHCSIAHQFSLERHLYPRRFNRDLPYGSWSPDFVRLLARRKPFAVDRDTESPSTT